VGGWGISIGAGGKAQASTSTSQKLAAMIQSSGEYSLEAWAAPANVAQTNAYIVSYSGSNTRVTPPSARAPCSTRDARRSSTTDTDGAPPLMTTTGERRGAAALQHVVLTYDPVNGQRIYVNGIYTGDADPAKGGSLANWGQHLRAGARQRDHRSAPVAGRHQVRRPFTTARSRRRRSSRTSPPALARSTTCCSASARCRGVSQSYILFQASQYDNFSLPVLPAEVHQPRSQAAVPANLQISGMRLGVNGVLAPAGQAYATLSASVGGANYTAANGQLLSGLAP